jgi:hypothetical protein
MPIDHATDSFSYATNQTSLPYGAGKVREGLLPSAIHFQKGTGSASPPEEMLSR